jgi:hypothetical protein
MAAFGLKTSPKIADGVEATNVKRNWQYSQVVQRTGLSQGQSA